MFSETLRQTLKRDVVGQSPAINSVVRGVTRLLSGMTPRERSWCVFLFLGPPGTGRTHLVRMLARSLHGHESIVNASCNVGSQHADPWASFLQQLGPLFQRRPEEPRGSGTSAPRVVLVQDLECARKEFFPMLARLLETGQAVQPDGRVGRLDNTVVVLTTALCAHEVLDETSRFGFAHAPAQGEEGDEGAVEEDAESPLTKACRVEAEKTFGLDLFAQLDDFVVFRRLEEEHLHGVLERHFARMRRWLGERGVTCEMLPAARDHLLECGSRQHLLGARDLIVAHRRLVEFPVADLMLSGSLPAGSKLTVARVDDGDRLHFEVVAPDGTVEPAPLRPQAQRVPVA